MPFEGSSIIAPVMAAKQGMMNMQLHGVSDQAKTVVQYVSGPLTGQGSGLLQPSTQSNASATQSSQSLTTQTGQAMTIGGGEFWGLGQSTGTTGTSWQSTLSQAATNGGGVPGVSSLAGAMAAGGGTGSGVASAASALSSAAGGGTASGAPGGLASALSGAGAGSGAGVAASAVTSATAGSLAPGTSATSPQFSALPAIPSTSRLMGVMSSLGGGMLGSLLGAFTGSAGGPTSVGSGMQAEPTNQFAGSGPAANYQADS